MHAMAIRVEIMEVAVYSKREDSAVNACQATKARDVKSILMTVKIINVKTMERVSMVFNRTLAVVWLALMANFVRRKFNFAPMTSTHAQTVQSALIIIHTILVIARLDSAVLIALRISMTVKITCVKMVAFASMASTLTTVHVRAILLANSVKEHQWFR